MTQTDRKAAIAAYKERASETSVYAVLCEASGETWIGTTPNPDTLQNRLWFTLKMGSATNKSMQAAWDSAGEAAFRYEILARFDDESAMARKDRAETLARELRAERGAETA
ncbi:GIY-YIG nuclease family protein [Falsigemmobacter faecalis]|uniref:GIY-YIG nuclease family protein n=1 Tax=Falsigemmobacter faecalis TaxID=2488730 RepID=A0A3P3DMB0_9RHOB|nr:GIY-YIG nuclease family protein [Falsigemmobacter faecalis]RRH74742.1 GIY-YIG nuclease family protein [Falsigemmobacter faecalis]